MTDNGSNRLGASTPETSGSLAMPLEDQARFAAQAGDVVVHGFDIEATLGRGGMGVVYRARQSGLNRIVALKMLIAGPFADPGLRARFLIEAESVAALEHPGIVKVFAFGESGGHPYLAMEFLPGGTLADRIKTAGPLPATEAASLVAKLAGAVTHAHSRGVVHRDIKPLNVLLASDGEPRLTDFGLAKVGRSDLSVTGQVLGTPAYMAPEQAAGKVREVGTAADVYALGAVLFDTLTGRPPFQGDTQAATIQKVLTEEPPRPRKLNAAIPPDLETICLKCLEKEPSKRYPTAQSLADDLFRYGRGEQISVRPAGMLERTYRWARRKPTLAAAYALSITAALLLGFGAWSVWLWRAAEEARGQLAGKQAETEKAKLAVETALRGEATAKAAAVQAFEDEQRAKRNEAAARSLAEGVSYGRTIDIANREVLANNIRRVRTLLDICPQGRRGWEWHYVHRQANADLLTIIDPPGVSFHSANFTPDGGKIVTALFGGEYSIWDARSGSRVAKVGTAQLVCADASRAVRFGQQDDFYVWDIVASREVSRYKLPTLSGKKATAYGLIMASDQSGARLAVSLNAPPRGRAAETLLYDISTGDEPISLKGRLIEGRGYQKFEPFSPDGALIATGEGETILLWEVGTGRLVHTLRGLEGAYISRAVFSGDSSRLVVGFAGKAVSGFRVWDTKTGAEVSTVEQSQIVSDISADGRRVVTSFGEAGKPTVWTVEDGKSMELKGYGPATSNRGGESRNSPVEWAVLSPDGTRVAAIGRDATFRVWNAVTGAEVWIGRGHGESIRSIRFSPDGKRLATASGDGTVRVWDAEGRTRPKVVLAAVPDAETILAAHAGPTGVTYAVVRYEPPKIPHLPDGRAARWVPGPVQVRQSGGPTVTLAAPSEAPGRCDFSPDGTRLVTCHSRIARVWNAKTGELMSTLSGHTLSIHRAHFAPDGERVVTAGDDGTARVWNARTGKELLNLSGHTGWVNDARFSPDGMRVLTADSSEVVTNGAGVKLTPGTARARVWDATTGKLLLALDPREHGIWCVCFSPDGRRLVTGGGLRVDQNTADATVVVWDAESGGELARLPGHGGGAWQMAFTPDGSRLIVTCARGPTKIWDAETGTDLIALEASDGMANSLVYDAVSTRILIAHDQTLVAWDAAPVNRAFLRFPVAPPPRTK